MTVFGVDIHPTFQAGLNVTELPAAGIVYVSCKVSEGTTWYRPGYHDFSAASKAAGLLFGAYHFLRSESSGAAQADWCRQCMGDDWGAIPLMVDWETSIDNTWADAKTATAFVQRVQATGGRVTLNYCPGWYWDRIGQPNLTAGVLGGVALVQSGYGSNPAGKPAVLYPGDVSGRWAGNGGKAASILQFGSRARIGTYAGDLDVNAFRGTRAQLAATGWFHDPQEAVMALGTITIDQDIATLTGNVYRVGQQVPVERLLEVIFQRADNGNAAAVKGGTLAAAALKAVQDAAAAEATRDAAELARDTVEASTLARIEDKLSHLVSAVAGIPGADTAALSTRLTGDLIAAAGRIRLTVETADTPGQHAAGL